MISVVIVNFYAEELLRRCLISLLKEKSPLIKEIILIDNGSNHHDESMLKKDFPQVEVIKNTKNIGFAKASNIGIKRAKCDFVLIMNCDIEITSKAISMLWKHMLSHPECGIVGAQLVYPDKKPQLSFGKDPSILNELYQKIKTLLCEKGIITTSKKRKLQVDLVLGACFLSRKEALLKAGLFDENYFLYFEDADLCREVRKCGWKVHFLSDVHILHHKGVSMKKAPELAIYEYRKSQIYYYKKHNSRLSVFCLRCYLLIKFGSYYLFTRKKVYKEILSLIFK